MPFVDAQVLAACAALLDARTDCDIATVVTPEASLADRTNPDVVKAVLAMEADGRSGRALYFTRSTLFGEGTVWRHMGIYGYRRAALEAFNAAPPSPAGAARAAGAAAGPGTWPLDLGRRRSIKLRSRSTRPPIWRRPALSPPARSLKHEPPAYRLPRGARGQQPRGLPRRAARLRAGALRHLRGRLRGGEDGRLQTGDDPGGELDRRPGRGRAPPSAGIGAADRRRALQADTLPADGQSRRAHRGRAAGDQHALRRRPVPANASPAEGGARSGGRHGPVGQDAGRPAGPGARGHRARPLRRGSTGSRSCSRTSRTRLTIQPASPSSPPIANRRGRRPARTASPRSRSVYGISRPRCTRRWADSRPTA